MVGAKARRFKSNMYELYTMFASSELALVQLARSIRGVQLGGVMERG